MGFSDDERELFERRAFLRGMLVTSAGLLLPRRSRIIMPGEHWPVRIRMADPITGQWVVVKGRWVKEPPRVFFYATA